MNAFHWNTGEPSVFNTPSERAKVTLSQKITALRDSAPRVEPQPKKKVSKPIKTGRPSVQLDVEQIKRMREQGLSMKAIGSALGVSEHTVGYRLNGRPSQSLRDNTGSRFSTPIQSKAATDRTNAIKGRRL